MNTPMDELTVLAQSFLRKLLYFDIFSHPLKAGEIFEYCDFPDIEENEGIMVLEKLRIRNLISHESGFYFIGNDSSKVVHRLECNELADRRMNDAKKYANIAANFPFVRAVFISGSLSKHVMKPDSDIDFFFITEPGKLWICRAFLTLFKKLFLWNSHRNFCLNYFIDSDNLEIPDKNLFTATEIAFLLPMYNYSLYKNFISRNNWYRSEFPNFKLRPEIIAIQPLWAKRTIEFLFSNRLGRIIDQLSFSVIVGFWRRKFRYLSEKRFSLDFRSRKNVSKHHPNAFQERVVSRYTEKILAFEQSTGFPLRYSAELKISNK